MSSYLSLLTTVNAGKKLTILLLKVKKIILKVLLWMMSILKMLTGIMMNF